MRIGAAAVAWAKSRTSWVPGYCQKYVRSCFDLPGVYGTAQADWNAAGSHQHHSKFPPPGVAIHWYSAPGDPGHTAMSLGDGICRSTDYPSRGRVGNVSIGALTRRWNLRYEGWASKTNDRVTWTPPKLRVSAPQLRHALETGGKVPNGRYFKRELAAVVGRGAMNLAVNGCGRSTRRRARKLEALWHGGAANGRLSNSDIRRLGWRRNRYTTIT